MTTKNEKQQETCNPAAEPRTVPVTVKPRVSLPVCTQKGGTLPGVDIDNSAELLDQLEIVDMDGNETEDRSVLSRHAAPPDACMRYGDLDEHIADVRYGKNDSAQRPLIILIHGGFWRPAFDRKHTGAMAVAIADAGWTIASIEYRRIPGNPDSTLNDVSQAISRLPSLVKQHNGKAIVIGHSAGGHLALWAAVKSAMSLVGSVALGPAADLQYGFDNKIGDGAVLAFLGSPPAARSDVDPCVMPSPQIATTIIHGTQDAIAPIAMAENYLARHPLTRLVRVDQCGHFAVIDPLSAAWPQVIEALNRLSTL